MIADRSSGVSVTSTMTGASYDAGIDDENMEWIIEMFTDLYSDVETALIREYSTNARDAQIEAGYDGPIHVTTPSALSSFLVIQDKGIGMDAETIRTVYSRYGTSTKRASDAFNGMLGIGCKSALTYTSQFTIDSVKDGVRTICSVSRTDGGVPTFQVVAESPTTAENGTTIKIPAKKFNHFTDKAAKLFRFWPEGSVLVDGKAPVSLDGLSLDTMELTTEDGRTMTIKPWIVSTKETHVNLIVMGGVPYPATDVGSHLGYNRRLVIEVEIGAVNFVPAREGLRDTPKTKAVIAAINGVDWQKHGARYVGTKLDTAKSRYEAIKLVSEWSWLIPGNQTMRWKGTAIPQTIDGKFVLTSRHSGKLGRHSVHPSYPLTANAAASTMLVTGFDLKKFSASHKKKLQKYLEDAKRPNDTEITTFALSEAATVDTQWADFAHEVDWPTIASIKLPRAQSSGGYSTGRLAGSYDVFTSNGGGSQMLATDIANYDKVFYVAVTAWHARASAQLLLNLHPKALVAYLPANRVDKFKRMFPKALEAYETCVKAYSVWTKALTQKQRVALYLLNRGITGMLIQLDAEKIDDPKLREAIAAAYVNVDALEARRKLFGTVVPSSSIGVSDWTNPLNPYTLLQNDRANSWSRLAHPHVYIYLNAVYAANNA